MRHRRIERFSIRPAAGGDQQGIPLQDLSSFSPYAKASVIEPDFIGTGVQAETKKMEIKSMARAVEWGHEEGFYQMVIDEASGRILGATMVCYEAAELVHVIIDLMEFNATWEMLGKAQHIHPTYAENLPSLACLSKA